MVSRSYRRPAAILFWRTNIFVRSTHLTVYGDQLKPSTTTVRTVSRANVGGLCLLRGWSMGRTVFGVLRRETRRLNAPSTPPPQFPSQKNVSFHGQKRGEYVAAIEDSRHSLPLATQRSAPRAYVGLTSPAFDGQTTRSS